MGFRLQDFECEDCNKLTEILLDSKSEEQTEELKCEHCGSLKIHRVISIGVGSGKHASWARWRS